MASVAKCRLVMGGHKDSLTFPVFEGHGIRLAPDDHAMVLPHSIH